jgi:photosystem II stability/assembly factor-like uncharacterized protein
VEFGIVDIVFIKFNIFTTITALLNFYYLQIIMDPWFKKSFLVWIFSLSSAFIFGQWNSIYTPINGWDYTAVHARTNDQVVVGVRDTVFVSYDGGANWNKRITNISQSYVDAIRMKSASEILIGGSYSGSDVEYIALSIDSGATWNIQHSNSGKDRINDFYFRNANEGYAVGDLGTILRTLDGGVSWTPLNSGTSADLIGIWFEDPLVGHAVGEYATLKTVNGGTSWTVMPMVPNTYKSVVFFSPLEGLACGVSGLYHTFDGGDTWVDSPYNNLMPTSLFHDIQVIGSDTVIVVGDNAILLSTTRGIHWEAQYLASLDFNEVSFANNSNGVGYIVGDDNLIWKTTNYGEIPALPMPYFSTDTSAYCQGSTINLTNYGNPAYTFTWQVDAAFHASTYHSSVVINTPGVHTISLTADNGVETYTYYDNVNILTGPTINNFTLSGALEECEGDAIHISVPSSQSGVQYQLMVDSIPVGSPVSGNNSTINFPGIGSDPQSVYHVVASATGACGAVELWVLWPGVVYPEINTGNTTFNSNDTLLCLNDTTTIYVSTMTAFEYTVLLDGNPFYGPVTGTGSVFSFPSAPLTSTQQYTLFTQTTTGLCADIMNKTITIQQDSAIADFQLSSNTYSTVSVVTPTNLSTGSSYEWNFGQNAVPPSSTLHSPSVSFPVPGVYNISLVVTSGLHGCTDTLVETITVAPLAPAGNITECWGQIDSLGMTVLDYHHGVDGFTYAVGYEQTTWTFANYNYIIVKYDSLGNIVWMEKQSPFDYSPNDYSSSFGNGVTSDSSGNVYVAGNYASEVFTIDGISISTSQANQEEYGGFVVKYNSTGTAQWMIHIKNENSSSNYGATDILYVDDQHIFFNVYSPGTSSASIVFADGTPHYFSTSQLHHLFRTDSAGVFLNRQDYGRFPTSGTVTIYHEYDPSIGFPSNSTMAITSPDLAYADGLVYVYGEFGGISTTPSILFGQDTISTVQDLHTGFVASSTIHGFWTNAFTTYVKEFPLCSSCYQKYRYPMFAVDDHGDAYVAYNVPSPTVGPTGTSLSKYNDSGQLMWENILTNAHATTIDFKSGSLHVYGEYTDLAYIDSYSSTDYVLPLAQERDIFYAQYDPVGNVMRAKAYGGVNDDLAELMATDGCSSVKVLARSDGDFDFGPFTFSPTADRNMIGEIDLDGDCNSFDCDYFYAYSQNQSNCISNSVDICFASSYSDTTIISFSVVGSPDLDTLSQFMLSTGTYTWNVPDSLFNGISVEVYVCTNSGLDCDTIDLFLAQNNQFSLLPDTTACFGNSINLNTQNSYNYLSYLWSTGDTTATLNATVSNSYTLQVTDSSGCMYSDTVNVLFVDHSFDFGADLFTCDTVPVLLDPVNSYSSYNWSTGSSSSTISVTNSGTYWLQTTDSIGCVWSDTVEVTIHPILTIDLGPDIIQCPGVFDSIGYTASTFVSVLWNTGSTDDMILPVFVGTYSITATDANGCIASDTIIITDEIGYSPTIINNGDTLFVAGVGSGTFQWYESGNPIQFATGSYYVVTANGNYHCVYTSANGCDYPTSGYSFIGYVIEEMISNEGLFGWPNPTSDTYQISISSKTFLNSEKYKVEIYNSLGDLISSDQFKKTMITIDVSKMARGIYIAVVSKEDRQFGSLRMVVIR